METISKKVYSPEEKLEFLWTGSIDEFKKRQGISSINIERAATTDGYAFSFAGKSGGISKNIDIVKVKVH